MTYVVTKVKGFPDGRVTSNNEAKGRDDKVEPQKELVKYKLGGAGAAHMNKTKCLSLRSPT